MFGGFGGGQIAGVASFDKAYALDGAEAFGHGAHGSATVQTAWALLGLAAAGPQCAVPGLPAAAARGASWLMARQAADGDWPQEGITGVFNRACGISYTQYRNVFPIWALSRYAVEFGE